MDSHRVRAKFIDCYCLLVVVASWITTLQLCDTTNAAQVESGPSVKFGFGPDHAIDTRLGNPSYSNLGSSHDAPFHEDASGQLVGVRTTSRSRNSCCSTPLVIHYGGTLQNVFSRRIRGSGGGTRKVFIVPMGSAPDVREFKLLRSHLLETYEGSKVSSTLRFHDFAVRLRRQKTRYETVSDRFPPHVLWEFLSSAGGEPLSDLRFVEMCYPCFCREYTVNVKYGRPHICNS